MNQHHPPRRETKFVNADFAAIERDGSFRGYAGIFGQVDLGNDILMPGAFARSLNWRGAAGIRMLYQHDPAEPIGVWQSIEEDARGLRVAGTISPATRRGAETLELLRSGAIDGLSVGFRTIRSREQKSTGIRRILEADLWEISVVTFPMQPGARVSEVKAMPQQDRLTMALRRAASNFRNQLQQETRT